MYFLLFKEWYNISLVENLLQILFSVCKHGSKIRLVTLDASIDLLSEMVMGSRSYLSDTHFAQLEGIKEESTLLLRNFYKSEEIFLDMFEDEYHSASKSAPRVELVLSDASLLLPPTVTPLTGKFKSSKVWNGPWYLIESWKLWGEGLEREVSITF